MRKISEIQDVLATLPPKEVHPLKETPELRKFFDKMVEIAAAFNAQASGVSGAFVAQFTPSAEGTAVLATIEDGEKRPVFKVRSNEVFECFKDGDALSYESDPSLTTLLRSTGAYESTNDYFSLSQETDQFLAIVEDKSVHAFARHVNEAKAASERNLLVQQIAESAKQKFAHQEQKQKRGT